MARLLPTLILLSLAPSSWSAPVPRNVTEAESDKAPMWPTTLNLADGQCQGVLDEQAFQAYLDTISSLNSYMHQHLKQIDLNGDGNCEYIAFQSMDCGVGGCAQASITVHGQRVLFLGGQPDYWHLHSADNGWLQLSTASNAGIGVRVQRLYAFREGRYQQIRQDRYEQQDTGFHYHSTVYPNAR